MAAVSDAEAGQQVVTFAVDDGAYCVDVDRVLTILGVEDGADVVDAQSDPWYAGEIALGEERIRVVDLARVVDAPTADPSRADTPQVIVFEATDDRGLLYGWLVDAVGKATVASTGALDRAGPGTSFVNGRVEHRGTRLTWLDERAINGSE